MAHNGNRFASYPSVATTPKRRGRPPKVRQTVAPPPAPAPIPPDTNAQAAAHENIIATLELAKQIGALPGVASLPGPTLHKAIEVLIAARGREVAEARPA